ncbi:hypothetical protein pb186bvf_002666 [Paramecium bursaria]
MMRILLIIFQYQKNMLKTIIIISIVILVNSQNSKQADCSKIDQIIKDVDVGLKLSKIKAELQTLTQFSQELESATQGFKTVVGFIKKLKDTYDHKVLLQTSQVPAGGPSKQQPPAAKGPNSPQITYNQLASALSEIRAVGRIQPELEKALHIFETMRDDIQKFRTLAKDLNIDQKQIDAHLSAQNSIQQCKGSKYVLEHNIYESSSSDEEEFHHESKQTGSHAAHSVTKQAPGKDTKQAPQDAKKGPIKQGTKQLGLHKQVKGHNKHNARHVESQKKISVKKR